MIYDSIKNFAKQFEFNPVIENAGVLKRYNTCIVAGMGGSHLAADLVPLINPNLRVIVHSDYGLPALPNNVLQQALLIANSYSGNTEETLDAATSALKENIPVAAISVGGKLLELARREGLPYIQLPDTGIQPRMATGYSLKALLKILGEEDTLRETGALATALNPIEFESVAQMLSIRLRGKVPVIYASRRNRPIAYNWKIKFNETGKIPAFYNVFPELNHNEMTGFDMQESTGALSRLFHFIFLSDAADDPRIVKRLATVETLYRDRGLAVEMVPLEGTSLLHKIFSSLVLADWTAYYTAVGYSVDPENVPMVEEFKGLVA